MKKPAIRKKEEETPVVAAVKREELEYRAGKPGRKGMQ